MCSLNVQDIIFKYRNLASGSKSHVIVSELIEQSYVSMGAFWHYTYSKSRVCIWMEDRKGTHCTGKNTHGVSIVGHWLYDILPTLKCDNLLLFNPERTQKLNLQSYQAIKVSNHTRSPWGTAECCEIANSQLANWLWVGKFPYTGNTAH